MQVAKSNRRGFGEVKIRETKICLNYKLEQRIYDL